MVGVSHASFPGSVTLSDRIALYHFDGDMQCVVKGNGSIPEVGEAPAKRPRSSWLSSALPRTSTAPLAENLEATIDATTNAIAGPRPPTSSFIHRPIPSLTVALFFASITLQRAPNVRDFRRADASAPPAPDPLPLPTATAARLQYDRKSV